MSISEKNDDDAKKTITMPEGGFDMDSLMEKSHEGEALMDITSSEALQDIDAPDSTDVDAIIAERDALEERVLRALADGENMRKRAERDRLEAEQYSGTKLARDMLSIYDNLTRALEASTEEQKSVSGPIIEGVELTLREILKVFSNHGIMPFEPKEGDVFNPRYHQAMFEAPLPDTKAGNIIQVMEIGFTIHNRLLRPAKVGVSSNPA